MDLATKIKSTIGNIEVEEIARDPLSIEVRFGNGGQPVTVTEGSTHGRYSANYQAIVRDGRGGWRTEECCSEDMLIDGVIWILKQVEKNGRVWPEM